MDVSDRVRAEAEVRRLNAELEQRIQKRTAELAEERNFVAWIGPGRSCASTEPASA